MYSDLQDYMEPTLHKASKEINPYRQTMNSITIAFELNLLYDLEANQGRKFSYFDHVYIGGGRHVSTSAMGVSIDEGPID